MEATETRVLHEKDEDCDLDENLFCVTCGVDHTGPACDWCGGVGFHRVSCEYRDAGPFWPRKE